MKLTPGNYESRYVKRDVTYLLRGKDVDRRDPCLDKSCAGEAEGPYRLARGMAYTDYLGQRHRGGTAQFVAVVPGVGHDGENMLKSACGVGVLFDRSRRACRPAKKV
ncbi:MAG: hypothetical protein M3T49_00105 [Candidatus Eremiobacteraeota bacterium]|nr:hypothetical protein [Candidatus Eremiobacteraeota bacterium]